MSKTNSLYLPPQIYTYWVPHMPASIWITILSYTQTKHAGLSLTFFLSLSHTQKDISKSCQLLSSRCSPSLTISLCSVGDRLHLDYPSSPQPRWSSYFCSHPPPRLLDSGCCVEMSLLQSCSRICHSSAQTSPVASHLTQDKH